MALRGPGGRFRKASQAEAAGGQGGAFAQLIATMQLDDEFYHEQLRKLETTTTAATARVNQAFGRVGIQSEAVGKQFTRMGAVTTRALSATRAAAFLLAGEMTIVAGASFGLVGRLVALSAAFGGVVTGLTAAVAFAVAYSFNIGGARRRTDELIQSMTNWYYGLDKVNERNERSNKILNAQLEVLDKISVVQGRLTPTTARIRELVRGGMSEHGASGQAGREESLRDAEELRQRSRERFDRAMERARKDASAREAADARFWAQHYARGARVGMLQRTRATQVRDFQVEAGIANPSQFIVDPIERMIQEFRERIAARETRTSPGFSIGSLRADAFTRFTGLGGLKLGAQSEEKKTLDDQLAVQREARDLLKKVVGIMGSSGAGMFSERN